VTLAILHPRTTTELERPRPIFHISTIRTKLKPWIHNAISLFTAPAKSLVACFYGQESRYSYYDGCSTGGAQGFALAQYHPTLFDGIVAGSPGNWYSHLALSFLWNGLKTQVMHTTLKEGYMSNYLTNVYRIRLIFLS
jgi:hypothetical protein